MSYINFIKDCKWNSDEIMYFYFRNQEINFSLPLLFWYKSYFTRHLNICSWQLWPITNKFNRSCRHFHFVYTFIIASQKLISTCVSWNQFWNKKQASNYRIYSQYITGVAFLLMWAGERLLDLEKMVHFQTCRQYILHVYVYIKF